MERERDDEDIDFHLRGRYRYIVNGIYLDKE